MSRILFRIYDASDYVVKNMLNSWAEDFIQLVAVEESDGHLLRVYEMQEWEGRDPASKKLTLIVRDKHLAQQDFNSLDTARDLLLKFTLKGK